MNEMGTVSSKGSVATLKNNLKLRNVMCCLYTISK